MTKSTHDNQFTKVCYSFKIQTKPERFFCPVYDMKSRIPTLRQLKKDKGDCCTYQNIPVVAET